MPSRACGRSLESLFEHAPGRGTAAETPPAPPRDGADEGNVTRNMVGTLTAAFLSALLAQAPTETRQGRAPQTDQTVPAARDTRLIVDNTAGEVVVHAWDKDSVRVQARHSGRAKVNVRAGGNTITVDAESVNGHTGSVDYGITAPAWMPIKIEGQYDFVSVEGIQGELSIETVRGDIVLKNVGSAMVKTIEGGI